MALVVVLVPLLVVSFALRLVAVPALRRRSPNTAAFITRFWTWLPLVLMVLLLAVYAWPLAILLTVAAAVGVVVQPGAFGIRRTGPSVPIARERH